MLQSNMESNEKCNQAMHHKMFGLKCYIIVSKGRWQNNTHGRNFIVIYVDRLLRTYVHLDFSPRMCIGRKLIWN